MNPKVTIGICVRNAEKLVGEAIESVLAQDFPHDQIRIVFVDDGSEDRTLSIMEDYVQKMNMDVVVLHTSWRGLGSARNTVIAYAEGEYILWVDGDMVLSPDFLTKLVRFMEKNPKAGIVKGRIALTPMGNWIATLEVYSRAAGKMIDYQSKRGQSKAVGTGGALWRIKAVKQVGGFDRELRGYNEDWDVELRMRRAGWLFYTIDATCCDYERYGLTWKSLWRRYWLRGYQTRYFLEKNKGLVKHYRMFPPAAFLFGLLSSFTLFKLTRQKVVFLLAVQSAFKMTAWYVGFIRSRSFARSKK